MSEFYGPIETFRNNKMDSSPSDVLVTDRVGTRRVKVHQPKLPTYEFYENHHADPGLYFHGTQPVFAELALPNFDPPENDIYVSPGTPIDEAQYFVRFGDAFEAVKTIAATTGTSTRIVKVGDCWMLI